MKYCPYCNTTYALTITDCPSCGAVDSRTKCDKCGAIHQGTVCPNCGFNINERPIYCPKCGNQTKARVCPRCGHDVASASTVKDAVASVASKAACKLTGHKWVGCRCARCGEIRDEGHAFLPIPGMCDQQCSVCGKTEGLAHQWNGSKCSRCGTAMGIADRFWNPVETRLPFLHLENKKNRATLGIVLFTILMFVLLGVMASQQEAPNPNAEILMPHTTKDFAGENYRNVVDELQAAGFTNIETKGSGDLITGWIHKADEVNTVAVAENVDYTTNKRYPKDVQIVINYFSFPAK